MNVPLKIGQKSSTCSTRYYYYFFFFVVRPLKAVFVHVYFMCGVANEYVLHTTISDSFPVGREKGYGKWPRPAWWPLVSCASGQCWKHGAGQK